MVSGSFRVSAITAIPGATVRRTCSVCVERVALHVRGDKLNLSLGFGD
jgi:hypothetical protein